MFLYPHVLRVRVAKYVKVPIDNIHPKETRFSYPEQHFFHQQSAYAFYVNQIKSKNNTKSELLLQKKNNILLYLKSYDSSLSALLTLVSSTQKYYKKNYKLSSLISNLNEVLTKHRLTFLGVDNELYIAYYTNNNFFKIVRISDSYDVYDMIAFEAIKKIGVGLPLYNNYIPIIVLENETFIVIIYDIINKTRYEVARYSIDFLEKQLSDYIKKITGLDISKTIRHHRESYGILVPYRFTDDRASKSFEICNNLSVCKTVFYIGNSTIDDRRDHIIFEMNFKIKDQKLHYELSIPRGLSLRACGLRKTPKKYVIENQVLSIRLPKGNYRTLNIVYYQNYYMIVRDFLYRESYYILDLKKHTKNRISNTYGYDMRFYIANNIIMIVHFTATKLSQEKGAWHLFIYDTVKRRFFVTLINDSYEGAKYDLVSYYYIEKCQKAVFMVGRVDNQSRCFYNTEQIITMHTVSVIVIINLAKISNIDDTEDIEKCKEIIKFPRWVEKYLGSKGSSTFISYVKADCTVDANNSMLYITAFVPEYKHPVITIAKNLCNSNAKFCDFDLGVPILRTKDITKDKNRPIYISNKAIKAANFPSYLHRYDWRGFYNFISSKTINTGLIFISYPDFLIIDRHYHRLAPFYKVFSDFYLTESLLIDSYLVGYYAAVDRDQTRTTWLAGLFVINDLTLVQMA